MRLLSLLHLLCQNRISVEIYSSKFYTISNNITIGWFLKTNQKNVKLGVALHIGSVGKRVRWPAATKLLLFWHNVNLPPKWFISHQISFGLYDLTVNPLAYHIRRQYLILNIRYVHSFMFSKSTFIDKFKGKLFSLYISPILCVVHKFKNNSTQLWSTYIYDDEPGVSFDDENISISFAIMCRLCFLSMN